MREMPGNLAQRTAALNIIIYYVIMTLTDVSLVLNRTFYMPRAFPACRGFHFSTRIMQNAPGKSRRLRVYSTWPHASNCVILRDITRQRGRLAVRAWSELAQGVFIASEAVKLQLYSASSVNKLS